MRRSPTNSRAPARVTPTNSARAHHAGIHTGNADELALAASNVHGTGEVAYADPSLGRGTGEVAKANADAQLGNSGELALAHPIWAVERTCLELD